MSRFDRMAVDRETGDDTYTIQRTASNKNNERGAKKTNKTARKERKQCGRVEKKHRKDDQKTVHEVVVNLSRGWAACKRLGLRFIDSIRRLLRRRNAGQKFKRIALLLHVA